MPLLRNAGNFREIILYFFFCFSTLQLTSHPHKLPSLADHDFYLEFPSNQPSVKTDGDTDLDAFTICLWLSTSVTSTLGIVRYSDQSTSDVLIGLSLSDNGHLYFSLGGEDR